MNHTNYNFNTMYYCTFLTIRRMEPSNSPLDQVKCPSRLNTQGNACTCSSSLAINAHLYWKLIFLSFEIDFLDNEAFIQQQYHFYCCSKWTGWWHSGVVVTVPVFGRRGMGFKSQPRQIFFRPPTCVHSGLKCVVVADLLLNDSLLPCSCERVYWSTWNWN